MNLSKLLLLLLAFTTTIAANAQEISILTWNIQDLGRTKDNAEIEFIAAVMKDHDLIAVQEIVAKDPAGARKVADIAAILNRSGSKWDYTISDPTTGSPNEKERYAFIWKSSKIQLDGPAWLEKSLAPIVCREPYLARFVSAEFSFLLANYHSIPHSKKPQWENKQVLNLTKIYPDDHVIMAGDYNINSADKFWNNLSDAGLKIAPYDSKSTLRRECTSNNKFTYRNHAIDFFVYENKEFEVMESGVLDFVAGCENLVMRRKISDHLPAYLKIK